MSQAARAGVVVAVSGVASDVGAAVLRQGGNAVDAAIATAFALAVTWPEAGNLGGGGFLLYRPPSGMPVAFDFREMAPAAASREMFVRPEDRTAHRRAGVPGTVAGLALAHRRSGSRPWKELVQPAVRLAGDGFVLDAACARSLNGVLRTSNEPEHAELHRVFDRPGGGNWSAGERLVQPDLSACLERIAALGPEGFYAGPTADLIAHEMELGGGLIRKRDLANYRAIERTPLQGTYRGFTVDSMPPVSSGGTTLLEALAILEQFNLREHDRWSPRTSHLLAEASRRAYRDRARYLGDPAFTEIPAFLTDKAHAKRLAATIDLSHASPSTSLAGDIRLAAEGDHTTHLSVVDNDGGAVSLTYTLESSYGGRIVVRGAGFLLNDEMNDFGWLPGVTDSTGRIGTTPNLVAPGKRMLSSMCPVIVSRDGKLVLVTGSPGGRTIINTVLSVLVNMIDFDMSARDAVDAPRLHHQWFPDRIRVERSLAQAHPDLLRSLEALGHTIQVGTTQGDAHTIWIDPTTGQAIGVPDHRIAGKASRP